MSHEFETKGCGVIAIFGLIVFVVLMIFAVFQYQPKQNKYDKYKDNPDVEFLAISFANYCYEHDVLGWKKGDKITEPQHEDWVKFWDRGVEYYQERIKK